MSGVGGVFGGCQTDGVENPQTHVLVLNFHLFDNEHVLSLQLYTRIPNFQTLLVIVLLEHNPADSPADRNGMLLDAEEQKMHDKIRSVKSELLSREERRTPSLFFITSSGAGSIT